MNEIETEQRDVHGWFELTYSNFLVLHRSLMQSMPADWQHRMVTCLDEIRQAFDHLEHPSFKVLTGKWCYLSDLSDSDMERLGVTTGCDEDADPNHECSPGQCDYFQGDEELDEHTACVFVPGRDPIPHYSRGRTHVKRADQLESAASSPADTDKE